MKEAGADWENVAAHVALRQRALGYETIAELVRASEQEGHVRVSDATWRNLLRAQPLTRRNKRRDVLWTLRWAPGSFEAMLEGGEPTELEPEATAISTPVIERLDNHETRLRAIEAILESDFEHASAAE